MADCLFGYLFFFFFVPFGLEKATRYVTFSSVQSRGRREENIGKRSQIKNSCTRVESFLAGLASSSELHEHYWEFFGFLGISGPPLNPPLQITKPPRQRLSSKVFSTLPSLRHEVTCFASTATLFLHTEPQCSRVPSVLLICQSR